MFSAGLTQVQILSAIKQLKIERPSIAKALKQMNAALLKLYRERGEDRREAKIEHAELKPLLKRTQNFLGLIEDIELGQGTSKPLMDVFFEAYQFLQVAEKINEDYCLTLSASEGLRSVQLNCMHPGAQLKVGYDYVQSVVGFSATLAPKVYFSEFLGLTDHAYWLRLPSPFPAKNQLTLIAKYMRVDFENRKQSAQALVELLAQLTQSQAGNYLIYLPSYEYLDLIASRYHPGASDERVLRQTVDMSDSESKAFIDSFTVDSRITGFAVIGGKFSEGIDLKGLRLRGAVIVSLGLAPRSIRYDDLALRLAEGVPGSDNDALAAMDSYDYAYRFPALQRVIQTAGRVVRSEHDRGVVILVDPRFCQSRNLDLLPEHWAPQVVSNAQEITEALNSFWQNPKQEELEGLERA